jgi:hypothetical protein
MDYEVIMTAKEIGEQSEPTKALEALRESLYDKIKADGKDPLHYIMQASNTADGGFGYTATYSEERKKHFEANPLK